MNLRSGSTAGKGVLEKQHRHLFEQGVASIFKRWTALTLAVENGWGGSDSTAKANDFLEYTVDWFYRGKELFADDLEVELEAYMDEEFSVDCQDGSPLMIAKELLKLYQECLAGDFSTVNRLAAAPAPAQRSTQETRDLDGTNMGEASSSSSSSSGEDDSDDAMEEAPAPRQRQAPVVDEDGFQMVQRGRRR